MNKARPELLSPAGDMERLRMALTFGANAVYLAGRQYGMRGACGNFDERELREAVRLCHEKQVRVHVTVNTLPRDDEMAVLPTYLELLDGIGADALIVADLGVFNLARRYAPHCELHISTQTGIVNSATAEGWFDLGAKRVVLARELSLDEILRLRQQTPKELEIETFIHGSMCVSFSGRCLLSNYMTGRDGNRGVCAQPCRWKYALMEEKRPGQYFPIYETEQGTYIMNSKDLCMIEHIPDLVEAGIDSLKIEGRMKTALYVATVARTYRKALDDYKKDPQLYYDNMEWYKEEIGKCTYREFTTGFFYGKPQTDAQIYDTATYVKNYIYLGTMGPVDENGYVVFEQKNKFLTGDVIEIMKPDGRNIATTVLEIRAKDGTVQESAPHASQELHVKFSVMPEQYDILRVKAEDSRKPE